MQRLSWINFIVAFFQGIGSMSSVSWSDEYTPYMNIINGAILMHSEEIFILRSGLATFIKIAQQFGQSFINNSGYVFFRMEFDIP